MEALTELRSRLDEIEKAIGDLNASTNGEPFSEEQRTKWNALNEEQVAVKAHVEEIEARMKRVADLAASAAESVEEERVETPATRTRKIVPDDPHDVEEYRKLASSGEELRKAYFEGALRVNEELVARHDGADVEASQERIEKVLKREAAGPVEDQGAFAQRMIVAGSPVYERAWAKMVAGKPMTAEETRAASLTNSAGGYAVPVTLDPSIILTSSGVDNPVRGLARVETITGNTWYGVSSTGISASYGAEVTEASDNAPTLAQPSLNVEKAQAFIPFSIEIGQDWGSFAEEMSRLFADAKDTLESSKFLTGLGHGSTEPQGLIAVGGATAAVSTATTAVFAVADLYSLEAALQVRSRARASIVANKAAFQKVRQFDTGGGASLWVQLGAGNPASLLGYPAYEWSSISSAVTTSGSTIMVMGDFSKFLIVDRVGMDVELIPHMFATANNRPSGQRGLYCYWRNSSAVLQGGLSANSAFQSLKLL